MIKDNAKVGSCGFSMIQSGGVNYDHVVIDFRSVRGGDINFNIEIYGRERHSLILNSTAVSPTVRLQHQFDLEEQK